MATAKPQIQPLEPLSQAPNDLSEARRFKKLQELDLRCLHGAESVNNEACEKNVIKRENINYLIALLFYASGLFTMAYWVLVSTTVLPFIGGLALMILGIKLFLKPISSQQPAQNEDENQEIENVFFSIKM